MTNTSFFAIGDTGPCPRSVPLPANWPKSARLALLHFVSLAHLAVTRSRSWCANSRLARVRLSAKADRLQEEVALLREELRIKDARLALIPAAERPRYPPELRMAILALSPRAAGAPAEQQRDSFSPARPSPPG